MRLFFSNTANQLSLSAGVVASDTILLFGGTATGWPSSPCKAVIDPDTDLAEVVLITAIGPSSFTVARGQDGTAAQNHVAGAIVEHRWSAAEADEANVHVNLDGGVHGITGDVVGTDDVQTLENKHIVSPTVDTATFQASDTTPAQASKAATTGTANIAEFQDPSGVRLTRVGQHGEVEVNITDATVMALLLKMAASQTADGLQIQTSAGTAVLKVDSKGRLRLIPSDLSAGAAAFKLVPPDDTSLTAVNFRNHADSSDTLLVTTLGAINNALQLYVRGDGSADPLRFPLDGSKFKVDTNGNLTISGDASIGGNVTADNVVTKVAYGSSNASTSPTSSEAKDTGIGDVTFTAVAGRKYRVKYVARLQGTGGDVTADIRIRDGGASSPTTSSTLLTGASHYLAIPLGAGSTQVIAEETISGLSAGTHKIAGFYAWAAGAGASVEVSAATGQVRELIVYDEGTV